MYKQGHWLTNNPKTIKSWYPRRAVKLYEGDPKATDTYSVDELKSMGIVGIYLDEDLEVCIKELPLCKNQKEWEAEIKNE